MTPSVLNPPKHDNARRRLEDDLRRMILSRTDDYDAPLTTEMVLAHDYHLSRNTVRKVLSLLTDEGLLRRKTGYGTFVVPPEERPAQQMKMRRFLLAVPDFPHAHGRNDFYTQRLISGITDYSFLHRMSLDRIDAETMNGVRLADQFRNLKFDGIIHDRPTPRQRAVIEYLAEAGVPQVTISRTVPGVPAFYFDYEDGMRQTGAFLTRFGHREILFADCTGPDIFQARQEACRREFARLGLDRAEARVRAFGGTPEEILAELKSFLDEFPRTTALFFSATLRFSLWKELKRRKVKIPEELSLLMLDDNDGTGDDKTISVLREPVREIGLRAAELLSEIRICGTAPADCVKLPGELVMRTSCGLPKIIK